MLENLEDVDEELVNLSTEPCRRALSYMSMWAFGNHYHVEKGNRVHHGTYDSSVATMFLAARRDSLNPNSLVSELKYVLRGYTIRHTRSELLHKLTSIVLCRIGGSKC
jgi:hypothetical protein